MAAALVVAPARAAIADTGTGTEGVACEVTYRVFPYEGGFTAWTTIKNTGVVTISGWTFFFPVPDGVEIIEFWNAEMVTPNPLSAVNRPWNGVVEPGQSVTVGFRSRGPAQPYPTKFSVNGVECSAAP